VKVGGGVIFVLGCFWVYYMRVPLVDFGILPKGMLNLPPPGVWRFVLPVSTFVVIFARSSFRRTEFGVLLPLFRLPGRRGEFGADLLGGVTSSRN